MAWGEMLSRTLNVAAVTLILPMTLSLQGCMGTATPEPVNTPVPTVRLSIQTGPSEVHQASPSTDPTKLYPESPLNSPTLSPRRWSCPLLAVDPQNGFYYA